MDQKGLAEVLLTIPPDLVEQARPHAEAANATGKKIAEQVAKLKINQPLLATTIDQRVFWARVMKGTSLLAGLVLVSARLPEAAPYLGFLIGALSVLDFVIGNHTAIGKMKIELDGIESITDVVDDLDLRAIRVIREVRGKPVETVAAYADYLEKVSTEISKGARDLRHRVREQENELITRLQQPAPAGAVGAVDQAAAGKKP
jgi:hypothetical protein